jgi:uncharacterized protein YndB with AHSA1/START domain
MAEPQVAPNPDEIVSEIHIAAPRERVFQALVDPAQVPQWWGQKGIYQCTKFECDLRPGGKWRSIGVSGDGRNFEIGGEYLEIIPPSLIVTTWIATWTGDMKTIIRWELELANTGTLVRIRHSGLAADQQLVQSYRGWPRMLGWLQALVERGETVDERPAASWR